MYFWWKGRSANLDINGDTRPCYPVWPFSPQFKEKFRRRSGNDNTDEITACHTITLVCLAYGQHSGTRLPSETFSSSVLFAYKGLANNWNDSAKKESHHFQITCFLTYPKVTASVETSVQIILLMYFSVLWSHNSEMSSSDSKWETSKDIFGFGSTDTSLETKSREYGRYIVSETAAL